MNVKYNSLSEGVKKFLRTRDIIDQNALDRFIFPTFENFRPADDTLKREVQTVQDFVKKDYNILIWGDEDLDGITSVFIMKSLFQEVFGVELPHYIPKREKEGYGLTREGIDRAFKNKIDLIITVDSGTTSFEEVEYLKEKGMKVIITDHHELKEKLPKAPLLNPKLSSFGYEHLAGAGVALKFADCLISQNLGKSTPEWTEKIPQIPAFAFIGTLADRVPLRDENRIIYNEGLKYLKKTESPSLSLLADKKNIFKSFIPLVSGRERLTWEFFTSRTIEEAEKIYSALRSNHLAWNRKARRGFLGIKKKLDNGELVIFEKNLPYRIASSVTSRSRDYCKSPVFVLYHTGTEIRGDGRSPEGFDLLSVLKRVKDLLINYGGHKCACGFTLKEGKTMEFKERTEPFLKEYKINNSFDSKLRLSEITEDLKNLIKKMKPFGNGNRAPIFFIGNVNYEKEGDSFFLSNKNSKLKLDRFREMPPPSKKINAYLEVKGTEVILKKWEWPEG